jgi:hypothetical protein
LAETLLGCVAFTERGAEQMKSLDFSRYTLCMCVAVGMLGSSVALAQDQGSGAIKKLAFLSGSWNCVIRGGAVPKGDVDHLSYTFSPDWSWMIERSDVLENGHHIWSTQLWGDDVRHGRLVAYQFTQNGVFTKSVDGWVGNRFQSKSDDNGATVTINPINKNAFDWVIESADHSSIVTEACAR